MVDFALEGQHDSAIYDGTKLKPGMAIEGPAIVEDPGSTVVIHPDCKAHLDAYGNLHIQLGA